MIIHQLLQEYFSVVYLSSVSEYLYNVRVETKRFQELERQFSRPAADTLSSKPLEGQLCA